ncbi:MAG: carbonic anhydrase [Aeromonadaceae bacterium]
MRKQGVQALAAVAALAVSLTAGATEQAHWGYEGDVAPAKWAQLSPEFATCGAGRNQSPIDIQGGFKAQLPKLPFSYQAGGNQITNNGHTIQVSYAEGSQITVDGTPFTLKQFHFHAPSENLIQGKQYPLEVHLVHADKSGNLTVIGMMFKEGKANPLLNTLWQQMPAKAGDVVTLQKSVNVSELLPSDHSYYRFSGSLTTPPCSEGVRWLVLKKPMTASKEQIEQFAKLMGHPNNRPVQPLGARFVVE